jgi:hypothetical protein
MLFVVRVSSHLCHSDRHLQTPFSKQTGSPLEFSYSGTHGTKYPLWLFPDPSKHIKSELEESALRQVCRRFELVREELQKELVARVQAIMKQLRKEEDKPDSSGLSDFDEDEDEDEWERHPLDDPARQYLEEKMGNN